MFARTEVDEIRQRAAKIRENWTPSERRRRIGLPPDLPQMLRNYLAGWPTSQTTSSYRLLSV